MPLKKCFFDDDGNEMQFFINPDNNLYVEIKNGDYPDCPNFIVLEREDIEKMILMLKDELNKQVQ